jgi:hypothetical protein
MLMFEAIEFLCYVRIYVYHGAYQAVKANWPETG